MAYRIDIPWEYPRGLVLDVPFHVQFEIDSKSGNYDPDNEMHALWERYRPKHAVHVEEFARQLIALYRGVELDQFPADLSKSEILKLTKRATIIVYRAEFEGEK